MKEGESLFELGQVVATPAALEALEAADESSLLYLSKHARGDWGELCPEDLEQNERALKEGSRLMSAYTTSKDQKIWIITEWDRSVTTILLPDDY
jgi:hypothetical protein